MLLHYDHTGSYWIHNESDSKHVPNI